jgi:hypothetical protein
MAGTTPEAHEKRPAMEAIDQAPFSKRFWHSRNLSPYHLDSNRLLQKEVSQYINEKISTFSEAWERQGLDPAEVCTVPCGGQVSH